MTGSLDGANFLHSPKAINLARSMKMYSNVSRLTIMQGQEETAVHNE